MKRGLTYVEAMDYVGVKRRTFDQQWRPHLVAIPQGACLIFDREDLDRLFDLFKQRTARPEKVPHNSPNPVMAAGIEMDERALAKSEGRNADLRSGAAVASLADRRPDSRKGVEKWVVKAASTKTPREDGVLTESTAVSAFRAVSNRIKKQSRG